MTDEQARIKELEEEIRSVRRMLPPFPEQLCSHRVFVPHPVFGAKCITCGTLSARLSGMFATHLEEDLRLRYPSITSPWTSEERSEDCGYG